ncbi:MAG TPA: L-seryl-tRNA(Sec) selenium transferase [Vicinamibacterales bacterium]|nr:L-seryl-tRNA(Sec) selenium transferase [Vicinamibacterales bacterium]
MPDYRAIPSIEQLRQRPGVRALEARYGRALVVDALRAETDDLRRAVATESANAPVDAEQAAARIEPKLADRLTALAGPSLRRVINATGVVVHTNLGRAPLSRAAAQRVMEVATGYSNLEYDLEAGARGTRDTHAERLICRLIGAEAAVVANNNAAATMLVLAALAAGREVIVSRGELVEIGGGFRVPDVLAQSGASLREVGTTNRTRASDYAAAIGDRTGLILRVHLSNFEMRGFTARPTLEELVDLGRRFSIPVAEDLGSGYLGSAFGSDVPGEPDAARSVAAGADVVCFSGDKLLGGPQAGIIAGRREPLTRIRKHPLMRALRVDKMTYAALEGTLEAYAIDRARDEIPVARMIAMTRDHISARASAMADGLRRAGYRTEVRDGVSTIGGGSAPGSELPTVLVVIAREGLTPDALYSGLRHARPPVIARIERDAVVLDLRTVLPEDDNLLLAALTQS